MSNHRTSIIVEGPDGMGKSTLTSWLAKEFNFTVAVCGPPPSSTLETIRWLHRQEALARNGSFVMDRATCISTPVYRQTFGVQLPEATRLLLSRALLQLKDHRAIFILCVTENPIHVPKAYDTLEGLERVDTKTDELIKNYRGFFARNNITYYEYNWRKVDAYDIMIDDVRRILNERA